MINILHTADWHIGQTFYGHDRTPEHAFFFDRLIETISERAVDVLLVAGDVFDVSNPSAAAQHELFSFIRRASHECPGLQIVMTAGNHDSAARLEAPAPLLADVDTVVRGTVPRHSDGCGADYSKLLIPLRGKSGQTEAYCFAVPFLRQGDYPAAASDDENSYSEGVRRFYQQMLDECAPMCQGLPIVVMGHMQMTGSEIAEHDHSERTIIGGLECVPPQLFADERIAYVALGHIHKAQRVSGMEKVRYAGSPLPMSFAEKNYRHGVVMVSIDGRQTTIERVAIETPVSLLSVPAAGCATADELPALLQALPDREGPADRFEPFLEIRVVLDEPDPMLPQRIGEALSGKAVRLTRVLTSFRSSTADDAADDAEEPSLSLQDMKPLQILRAAYQNKYHTQLPDTMERMFSEVCTAVAGSEI
jgi:exonuclease SbcD